MNRKADRGKTYDSYGWTEQAFHRIALRNKTNPDAFKVRCKCGEKFPDEKSLEIHRTRVHANDAA